MKHAELHNCQFVLDLIDTENSKSDDAPIGLSSKQANFWRKFAVAVSWISIGVALVIGITEFGKCYKPSARLTENIGMIVWLNILQRDCSMEAIFQFVVRLL